MEDHLEQLLVAHDLRGLEQPVCLGLGAHALAVDPVAVVADRDDDLATLLTRG